MATVTSWHWETREFVAAPAGWRIATLWEPGAEPYVSDLPGWLVQEQVGYNDPAGQHVPVYDTDGNVVAGERRVIAGSFADGQIEPGDDTDLAFTVLSPSEPELTDDHREELERRAQLRVDLIERRRRAREAAQEQP